jgi:putative DNA primase/helicase
MVRSGGVGMSTDLPDFKIFCRDACIKLWGEPDRETAKELRWSGDDAYSERTFDQRKGVWFDAGQERGGSTLELALYAKSKPPVEKGKLRGALFFEAWTDAFELGLVPDPPPAKPNGKGGKWPPIRATYPYQDEDGALLFEVLRFDTADPLDRFRQRQPDGKGGWIWNVKGVRQVLFRLPQLIAAREAGERIWLCEGERDCASAVRLGYAATTWPGGINKWRPEYDEFFRGADVVIVSDNDQQARDPKTGKLQVHPNGQPVLPGQDHAVKLTRRLSRVAAQARMIIPPAKDLSEWIEAGGTREALDALIAAAPDQVKQPNPEPEPQPEPPENEDGGFEDRIALDFSAQYAADLRYVAMWNKWLQWDNVCWRMETTLKPFDLARELCRDAGNADHRTVAAVTALARADRRQAATVEQWDTNPWLLGTPGGTVDLRNPRTARGLHHEDR